MRKAFLLALLLALGASSGVIAQGSTKQDNSGSAAAPGPTTPSPGGAATSAPGAATTAGGAATGTPPAGSPTSGPDPANTSPHPSPLSPAESGGPRPGGGVGGGTR